MFVRLGFGRISRHYQTKKDIDLLIGEQNRRL